MEICTLIVASMLIFISWAFLKEAEIPFTLLSKSVEHLEDGSTLTTAANLLGQTVI